MNVDNVTYFDNFGVEHIPKEIKKFIDYKNSTANIFRVQAYVTIMCGYFCIGFADFVLKGRSVVLFVVNAENLKTLKYHTF